MHLGPAKYLKPEEDDSALIARHGKLISYVARRIALHAGPSVSADDLWSAGALGLIEAARRYDKDRAVRFETFAEHRIRGAMLDELRRLDHLPRRLRADTEKVRRAQTRLSGELGRESTSDELASHLGMDAETLSALSSLSEPALPLTPDLLLPSSTLSAEAQLSREEVRRSLETAIKGLPERLMTLISLYYVEDLTYREIAQVLEVSEARICQLHSEAISKLRMAMTTLEAPPEAPRAQVAAAR
jgi:RNA polymerase sigma factor for flagellar operon FliA